MDFVITIACILFSVMQEKPSPFIGSWELRGFFQDGRYEHIQGIQVWRFESDGSGSDHYRYGKSFSPVKYFKYTADAKEFSMFRFNRTKTAFHDTSSWNFRFSADQDTLHLFSANNKIRFSLSFMQENDFKRKFSDENK